MSRAARHAVRVERRSTLGGADVWLAVPEHRAIAGGEVEAWVMAAAQAFGARPELAWIAVDDLDGVPPVRMFNGLTAELIGLPSEPPPQALSDTVVEQWVAAARAKGLAQASWADLQPPAPAAIRVGIDAAWLLGGESGAQVVAQCLVRALSPHVDISCIVLLSDSGEVPSALRGVAKVSGMRWEEAVASSGPFLDVLHRPYQPGVDVDYQRYLRVAHSVVITVLDFIAYDNPGYHASDYEWRRYQQAFDEQVCRADAVFTISGHVGSRLSRQFAHRLAGVQIIPPGTDHLAASEPEESLLPADGVPDLPPGGFLLVLGNDFEHKNRDFAVRVFAEMCDRGYPGKLVLAGFHLDTGSTFHHELEGAGSYRERIIRAGAVSPRTKAWLLTHAQAVLYPTSSEGFGLVPFEAARLGTPTAFVRFGPLRELLPGVDACEGWLVRPFADHVFRLLANPAAQVDQIRSVAANLTWSDAATATIDAYRTLLHASTPWSSYRQRSPSLDERARRALAHFASRAGHAIRRRLTGTTPSRSMKT